MMELSNIKWTLFEVKKDDQAGTNKKRLIVITKLLRLYYKD